MTFRTIRGLLRCAPDAGGRLLAAIGLLTLPHTLAPAALALVTAALIGRIQQAAADALVAAAAAPLLLFALVLGVGHAADAALEPLQYLAASRVDGAYRARITEIAATGATIDGLEDPRAQKLVRAAKADPDNWTERTPGTGLTGLIRVAAILLGVLAAGAVLARFAWWLPASGGGARAGAVADLRSQEHAIHARLAGRAARHDPGQPARTHRRLAGGEQGHPRLRARRLAHRPDPGAHPRRVHAGLGEAADQGRVGAAVSVCLPFGTALALVAQAAATGHTTVAVESAVFSAGLSVYQALAWNDNLLSVASAGECLTAYEELVALLGTPGGARVPTPRTPATLPEPAAPAAEHTEDAEHAEPAAPLPDRVPAIAFEGVGFRYPAAERTVLDGVDLEIRPGELLALVGLNGAGKSTLIKLLSMLYDPTAGRITADGTDLARLGAEAWRSLISVVFQDFVRYELSAADNVLLGRGELAPDLEELDEAARESGFAEVLDRLPDGWDTPLARTRTGGVDLSVGQWQQLVLTRALYALRKGARLLVLDEPTAHLDVRTEFDVFHRLAERRGEASIVLISHRLSTVRYADRIVLLDGGQITETGTHEELIEADGEYARMLAIQAERFNAGYEDHIEEGELL